MNHLRRLRSALGRKLLPKRYAAMKEAEGLRRSLNTATTKLADRADRIDQLVSEGDALRSEIKLRTAEIESLRREFLQSGAILSGLLPMHTHLRELPPPELRLHVGTITTEANFLHKGWASAQHVLQAFGETPGGPILDWGCGSGRTLNWLLNREPWRAAYHGCDVDASAIEWLKRQGIPSVATCGDDPPLPYPDNYFAGVFSFSVLTHISPAKHRAWYAEMARILRPGGRALCTTHGDFGLDQHEKHWPAETRADVAAKGWSFSESEGWYKHMAVASTKFSRQAFAGLLVEESLGRYADMDAFVLRKEVASR